MPKIKAALMSCLKKRNALYNVVLLSGTTIMAQAINVMLTPILSRLYSPSDFGVLSLFLSIVGIFTAISGFRYHFVIPLVRRTGYVNAVVQLSVAFQLLFVGIFTAFIILWGDFLQEGPFSMLFHYRYLMPVAVLCIGMYAMLVQWAIREKYFDVIAKTKLSQTVAGCAIKILGAFIGLKPLSLIIGNIVGQSLGVVMLLKSLYRKSSLDTAKIKRVALSYRNMLFFDTPAAVLDSVSSYVLPLIIACFFDSRVVGSFSMAQNVLCLPSAVIGVAIGQVFTQRAVVARYNGNLDALTSDVFEILAMCGMLPVLFGAMLCPVIFVYVLGPEWKEAGHFAKVLGPWIALNFVYSPLSILYTILMRQKTRLTFMFCYAVILPCAVIIGRENPDNAILCISVSGALVIFVGICQLLYMVDIHQIWRRICCVFCKILGVMMPIVVAGIINHNSNLFMYISILMSIIIYCGFIYAIYKKYTYQT